MSIENQHWYCPVTREARHFITKRDGSGNRPTTLRDARVNGWVPSVTTILKCIDKPALRDWITRQAVMAVVTAPDVPGESLDAKIVRVLETERQQDQESQMARDRGTEIHAAIEALLGGHGVSANILPSADILPWVLPAFQDISARGKTLHVEHIVIGDGYGGKVDLIQEAPQDTIWIWDWKTTKKLPEKGAWPEHRLQGAAYASAFYWGNSEDVSVNIRTGNIYISTVDPGAYVICEHAGFWAEVYREGFAPLVKVWQWMNNYVPNGPARVTA